MQSVVNHLSTNKMTMSDSDILTQNKNIKKWVYWSAVAVGRCVCSGLQGPAGHLQGAFPRLVPTDKSGGMDENASLDAAELGQLIVADAAPLLEQGQSENAKQGSIPLL